MKFTQNVKRKIMSVALATAMAFGFAVAPVPALLDGGQSVVEAAQPGDAEVTVLPDPDKSGGSDGSGGGSTIPLGMVVDNTTIYNGQTISNNGIVLIGFNKNVTTKRNKNPLPYDAIDVNKDLVYVSPLGDDTVYLVHGSVVSDTLLEAKNNAAGTNYDIESYRNYIYLNTTGLAPGQYQVNIKSGVLAANGETTQQPLSPITFNIQ